MRDKQFNIVLFFLGFIAVPFLAIFIRTLTFKTINRIDSSIWYRYASANLIDSMVFIKENTETEEFLATVAELEGVKSALDSKDTLGLYEALLINFDKIREHVKIDTKYCDYLNSQGLSIDDFETILKALVDVKNVLLKFAFYIVLLAYCFYVVVLLRMRKIFYIMAGVIYIIMIASVFSSGISDYLLTILLNVLYKVEGQELTYVDAFILRDVFLSAFKESMLTFIIFDTVLQATEAKRDGKKKYSIEYYRESIAFQKEYLRENVALDKVYIGRLNVPINYIKRDLSKQKKYWEKCLKHQKVENKFFFKYRNNLDICQRLINNIDLLLYNSKEHEKLYYINLLRSTEILIAQAYKQGIIGCDDNRN